MKVLLAGASGLIGGALGQTLGAEGHEVTRLVRSAPTSAAQLEWHPERGELPPAALTGVDAVVCMSGAGVADHRWTDNYRQVIRDSRVDTVATLATALADQADERPRVFLAASAVGYYGDTGSAKTDESGAAGRGFLARVCQEWEAAAEPAVRAGVRVVYLRTGLVLAPKAGLLGRLQPLFKLGGGGRLGSGRQYWPWISLLDEVAALRFLLTSPALTGAVNVTGPEPVTNAEFTAALGRILHRPALVPVPGFALRLALGEFAGETLTSQRVIPTKLLDAGFTFAHPDVDAALRFGLGH